MTISITKISHTSIPHISKYTAAGKNRQEKHVLARHITVAMPK